MKCYSRSRKDFIDLLCKKYVNPKLNKIIKDTNGRLASVIGDSG